MFPLENIKRQIDFKLKYGIVDFEITGGEPGEFKSLVSVCKYIKSASPRSRIAVITNGSLVSQPECLEYVDEVLLSYHLSRR
jgi:MoaA/NifB/PqqE/SkfB family radical SAM enzyme